MNYAKKIGLLLACLALVGCGAGEKKPAETTAETTAPSTETKVSEKAVTVDEKEKHSHDHDHDHDHDFKKESERFIPSNGDALKKLGLTTTPKSAIVLSWTETGIAHEAGVPIVGMIVNNHIDKAIQSSYESISDESGKIDYDKIATLKPEVAIVSQSTYDKDEEMKTKLKEAGVAVYQTNASSFDDVLTDIGTLGAAFETVDKTKATLAGYLERIDEMVHETEEKGSKKVALLQLTKDGITIASDKSFADSLLKAVKLTNAAFGMSGDADNFGFIPTDIAAIMAQNPDAIVIMNRVSKDADEKKTALDNFLTELKTGHPDASVVKGEVYDVIDHHGVLPKSTMNIAGIESIFTIAYK